MKYLYKKDNWASDLSCGQIREMTQEEIMSHFEPAEKERRGVCPQCYRDHCEHCHCSECVPKELEEIEELVVDGYKANCITAYEKLNELIRVVNAHSKALKELQK